ncbi:MAG TPA: class I SAM-dependent methyltransferase [Candidatus Nitrosotenuis sp.]|jgi:SAM-dependent methyltransferase|nr:class I SAM-dependent methyltransferase [Candidatus Nitrosotenuis sp.]
MLRSWLDRLQAWLRPGLRSRQALAQRISDAYWRGLDRYDYKTICPTRWEDQVRFTETHVLPRLDPAFRVVDLGCADGWYTALIAPHVRAVDAFDISPGCIATAQAKGLPGVRFAVADLSSPDFYKDLPVYDAAFCMGLFTCFLDDGKFRRVLRRLRSRVRPGGHLFLKDTLVEGATTDFAQVHGLPLTPDCSYAARYRNRDEYVAAFAAAGFTLVEEVRSREVVLGTRPHFFVMAADGQGNHRAKGNHSQP